MWQVRRNERRHEARETSRRQVLGAALSGAAGFVVSSRRSEAAATGGDAEVLVHGVAELPAGELAWRLVQDVAELPGKPRFELRALGFMICRFAPILVTEQATGAAFRLEAFSAAFVPEGVSQMRESLGVTEADYLRLALVPPEQATDRGGDRLLFGGRAFASPGGRRAMTLTRLTLQADETETLDGGAGDAFVLTEQGSALIAAGADERTLVTTVGSDTSYGIGLFTGPLAITGERDGTLVIVAGIR